VSLKEARGCLSYRDEYRQSYLTQRLLFLFVYVISKQFDMKYVQNNQIYCVWYFYYKTICFNSTGFCWTSVV